MRIVIQRVKQASVAVDGTIVGEIQGGLLLFLGIASFDTRADVDYLVRKTIELRIFEDALGKMNVSAIEAQAQILVVSQFTLYGNCDKGRRPSFEQAADPTLAEGLYNYFVERLKQMNVVVATGRFKAMMQVALVNDGPVTFILESNGHH